jgi:pimeloyl-ACP methyl ester carboxylesterase
MGILVALLYTALGYVLIEVIFYVYAKCFLAPKLNKILSTQTAWFKDPDSLLNDVFDMLKSVNDVYPIETFLSGSFRLAAFEDIHAGNFDSFLAWALYTSHLHDTSEDEKTNIVTHRKRVEKQFNLSFQEGTHSGIDHIKFNLDDLGYIHHPLSLSMLVKSIDLYSDLTNFYWRGFRHQSVGTGSRRGTYWIREIPNSKKSPLVFFHGICSGWFFYAKIVTAISSDRTVILYDYDCTKLNSLSFTVFTAQEVNSHVMQILKKHDIEQKITLFGHSWGTYLAGYIIRLSPQVVQHLVLVDPVCFVATLPETVYTVLYKPSVTTEDYLLAYFLRADLTLAHTLKRHVAWYNIYFSFSYIPDDIAVTVGLASGDILLSFPALNKMTDSFISSRVDTSRAHSSSKVASCSKLVWQIPHAEAMVSDTCIAEIKLNLFEHDTANTGTMDSGSSSSSSRGDHDGCCDSSSDMLQAPLLT